MRTRLLTCASAVAVAVGTAASPLSIATAGAQPGPGGPCRFGHCGPERPGPGGPQGGPGGPSGGPGPSPAWRDGPGPGRPWDPPRWDGGPPPPPPGLGWRGIDQGRFDHQPFAYNGAWVTPIFNPDFNNWGFWFFGIWIPL